MSLSSSTLFESGNAASRLSLSCLAERSRHSALPPSCPSRLCSPPPLLKTRSLIRISDLKINGFQPRFFSRLSIALMSAFLLLSSVTTALMSSISILATSSFLRRPDTMLS